jgi:hypothetical protein
LPPVGARVLAFVSILVGGLCGGLIGVGVVNLQCTADCTTPSAVGGLVGAVVGAMGVAVVAVLALRAMGEWRTIEHGRSVDRPYVFQAEDSRGPSLMDRVLGEPRDAEQPAGELEPPDPERPEP